MQEEIFFIVMTAIIAGTVMVSSIVRSIFKFLSSKNQPVSSAAGGSLKASELEAMLRNAVEEATAPLVNKIDVLEQRLDARADRLLDAPSAPPIGLVDDEPATDAPADRLRRRVR